MTVENLGRRRAARRRDESGLARDLGRRIASALLLEPSRLDAVLKILQPGDLTPEIERLVEAISDRQGAGLANTLPDLAIELEVFGGIDRLGGVAGLAQIADIASTAEHVEQHARELRALKLEERQRFLYSRLAQDPRDAEAKAELAALEQQATPEVRGYLELAPTRDDLEAMAAAPPIVPVATHLFYPRTTTVLAGQTNTGKTTATSRACVDLAYGREPWTGRYDGRGPLRVLLVSKDDTTLSLVRKVRALAPDDAWMDGRITLIGKEKRALPLGERGVERLGNTIADGRFDVFVVDPYAHFLPPGLTVNDDEGARWTIDQLDRIAESLGVSGVLIHHPRKRPPKAKPAADLTKGERLEEIRGSAVLAQLARAVATLWEVEPGIRMLDAVVNDVPPLPELYFETATYGDNVVRWELAGPPTSAEADAIRGRLLDLEPGTYNATDLARHLFEIAAGKKPSGPRRTEAGRHARRIADEQPDRFQPLPKGGLEVL